MFIDGIELLIALKHVFKIDRIRLIAYSLYSYGFPLLFVFLSSTLSVKNGNGLNQLYVSQTRLSLKNEELEPKKRKHKSVTL